MRVQFPKFMPQYGMGQTTDRETEWHRYYNIHFDYILNILAEGECDIRYVDPITTFNYKVATTAFEMFIDDNLVLIDFSDHVSISVRDSDIPKYKCIFKLHYLEEHASYGNVFPFSPVNFNNWVQYRKMQDICKYKATGQIINKQSIAGAAVERRTIVRQMLVEKYNIDPLPVNQNEFLNMINDCLVSVCVPGARNNMLDRGQGQYMFLGACTISPALITILSHNKKMIPGQHYIECKPDYSDLIEKIEWCKNNKQACIEIGQNARTLFLETSTPAKQIEWIKKCVHRNEHT